MCCQGNCNWYVRINGANPNLGTSYVFVGPNPPACPGSGKICAICAVDDGTGHPIIDSCLLSQMVIALSTGLDQACVLLRALN